MNVYVCKVNSENYLSVVNEMKNYLVNLIQQLGIFAILMFCIAACHNTSKTAADMVDHWLDKKVIFPANSVFTLYGKDTVDYTTTYVDYKLLVYVDTVGCTSCKLQLEQWHDWIQYLNKKSPYKVSYLFYFFPKNAEELKELLEYNKFPIPVCMDEKDEINHLNHFNKGIHVLLLDENDRVVLIGNPILNPKIKDLYWQVLIPQEEPVKTKNVITTVLIKDSVINLGKVHQDSISAVFQIENIGKYPYFISSLQTSCGCTLAEYDKKTLLPGGKTYIRVKVNKKQAGFFRETIVVYSNISDNPTYLVVQGDIK